MCHNSECPILNHSTVMNSFPMKKTPFKPHGFCSDNARAVSVGIQKQFGKVVLYRTCGFHCQFGAYNQWPNLKQPQQEGSRWQFGAKEWDRMERDLRQYLVEIIRQVDRMPGKVSTIVEESV